MKIMFVRHAEPYYAIDSLTEKGHREAELLSRRLSRLDVKDFYTSPLGRARETARYTLEKVGREAEVLPWLAEFRGRSLDPETGGTRIPWDYKPSAWMDREGLRRMDEWLDDPLMAEGNVAQIWQETTQGLDALLKRYGFTRDGHIYRASDNKPDTIVLFCHFGIMMACLSHLIGITPMNLWHGFCTQPSSVTTVITEERVKGEVAWRCMQLGDISHLYAADEPYSTAALFPECYTGVDSTNPPEWKDLGYE
ncbi:MAG: histidine phosphatase family protein [Clostridiales bacterium]|nr:histidine phosphatase family protein [Clostridiales bacterium]